LKNIIITGLMITLLFSCVDTTDQKELYADFMQIPGCLDNTLSKNSLNDDCFDYEFDQVLQAEFCLSANCYPDSARFRFNSSVIGDTITITVVDTASNLANCVCTYKIEAEFVNLENDNYVFQCFYQDSVYYSEPVIRESAL